MPYLVSAVAIALTLTLLNLLLTLGVIRRLRELTTRDTARPGILDIGRTPADFTAVDTDGRPVTRPDLTGPVLVGFFSTTCSACVEELPGFVARAGNIPGGRNHALAVVQGDRSAAEDMARLLTGAARVVVEEPDGALATAFQVAAFPAFCLLDDGVVQESGTGTSRDPAAAMV